MQFYVMLMTKKREAVLYHAQDENGVQFYVVLRTKVGCSFTSCLGRGSDAVLRHAQDEKGGAVLRRAQDEGRMQFYVMPRTRKI